MKKKYEKPGIYIENFALSQKIATACGAAQDSTLGKPVYGTKETCGWSMGNTVIWLDGTGRPCDFEAAEKHEGVCYNNPSPMTAIFSVS